MPTPTAFYAGAPCTYECTVSLLYARPPPPLDWVLGREGSVRNCLAGVFKRCSRIELSRYCSVRAVCEQLVDVRDASTGLRTDEQFK